MKHFFLRALIAVVVPTLWMIWPGDAGRVLAAPMPMFATFDCGQFAGPQYPKNPPPGFVCISTLAGSQLVGWETSFSPIDAGITAASLKIYSPKGEILYKTELICANCKKKSVPKSYELTLATKDQKTAEKFLVKGNRLEVAVRTKARVTDVKMDFNRGSPEKR